MGGRGQQRPGSECGGNEVGGKEQRESLCFPFLIFTWTLQSGERGLLNLPSQSLRAAAGRWWGGKDAGGLGMPAALELIP